MYKEGRVLCLNWESGGKVIASGLKTKLKTSSKGSTDKGVAINTPLNFLGRSYIYSIAV